MINKFNTVANLLLPRYLFTLFSNYKDVFERYLDTPENRERFLKNDLSKAFILKQIITDCPDIAMAQRVDLYDFMKQLEPENANHPDKYLKGLKKLITKAYGNRNFYDFNFLLDKIGPLDPVYKKFYELYARQFLKADVQLDQWLSLLASAKSGDKRLFRNVFSQLLIKYIQDEDLDAAIKTFKEINKSNPFSRQDIRISIGVLKLALKKGDINKAQEFRKFVEKNIWDKDLRIFSKLKLFEIHSEIDLKVNPDMDLNNLSEQMFTKLKSMKTSPENKEYIDHVEKTYHIIAQKYRTWLDVRISGDQQKQLIDLVKQKIRDKVPFLLLRLGDADSYGLESVYFDRKLFQQDCDAREMKWWRENLPMSVKEKIRKMFRETVYATDVLGIPSIYRIVSDLPDMDTSFIAERNQRGSVVIMDSMRDLVTQGKFQKDMIFTENRCHHVLLNRSMATELAKLADHVVVVSQYNHDTIQKIFDFKVDTVQIPGEQMRHQALPYKIDDLVLELESKVKKGSLVFVGAGFAGKYFLKVAKDHGAIGLDVGAMVDYWMGIKSRGVAELV